MAMDGSSSSLSAKGLSFMCKKAKKLQCSSLLAAKTERKRERDEEGESEEASGANM